MRRRASSRSLGLPWLAFAACITQGPSAYPLYPNAEPPLSNEQVGVLTGPFAVIDGQRVSDKGQVFALLPGCHTLRLVQTTGELSSTTGSGYVESLPQATISVQIAPGHRYSFERGYINNSGPVGEVTVGIYDHGRDGSVKPAGGCVADSAAAAAGEAP